MDDLVAVGLDDTRRFRVTAILCHDDGELFLRWTQFDELIEIALDGGSVARENQHGNHHFR